jgi:UDP-GlcNAc:undecaprenyl-phosphate GlcNAc-1-phosphate transferase
MLVFFDVTCVAFLLALILTPWIRNLAVRFAWVDVPDTTRKLHLGSIPRVGGIAVALAYAISLIFIVVAPYSYVEFDIPRALFSAFRLAPAAVTVLLIGLVDDIKGLRPWQKLFAEVIAALLAYWAGFAVHILHGQALGDWLSVIVTVLWLVGCTNALNLIDGMDGLAAGVGVFATLTSFVAALVHKSLELAVVTAPLAGALVGFLRYNFNPASIFLGDCGSLFIGFLLGCFGTMWSQKSATVLGMTAPLIALAMPLLDTALTIIRRLLRHQPVFTADHGHIHHRLLAQGLTPRRAVVLLYGFCGVAAAFSLLQDVANQNFGGLVIILFCVAAWFGVQHLGYAEFGIASRLVLRGSFRSLVNAQLRLQQFEDSISKATTLDDAWPLIVNGAKDFGFSGVLLRTAGHVFDYTTPSAGEGHWQLCVPLPQRQFLNLNYDPGREMHPLIFASFPKLLERFLKSRIQAVDRESDRHHSIKENAQI